MNKVFFNNFRNVCNKSSIRIDNDVFRLLRRLGIGVQPPTRRGTRAGRLHRIWHCQPVSRSYDVSTPASSLTPSSQNVTDDDTRHHDASITVKSPQKSTRYRKSHYAHFSHCIAFQKHIKIMHLNAQSDCQSCGNKTLELAETQ